MRSACGSYCTVQPRWVQTAVMATQRSSCVVNEHGGTGAELEHEHRALRQLLRVFERDLGDGGFAHLHFSGRGKVAIDRVRQSCGVAQARGTGGSEKGAPRGLFAGVLGDGLDL